MLEKCFILFEIKKKKEKNQGVGDGSGWEIVQAMFITRPAWPSV